MADEFKLIQVHADEEDVVIQAGVLADEGAAAEQADSSDALGDVQPLESIVDETPVQEAVPEPEPAPVVRKVPERKQAKAPKDTYRETTLEDLQSEKMPTAQKVVIIAAVICIIGALVYYFVFMR